MTDCGLFLKRFRIRGDIGISPQVGHLISHDELHAAWTAVNPCEIALL